MKITHVKIERFRSILVLDEDFTDFNILVWQNNHWKTNFFDAINWFFNWFNKWESKDNLIFSWLAWDTILVELTFMGLQDAIESMTNESKKTALQSIFWTTDTIKVRRTTEFEDWKKRQLYNLANNNWENTMWADGTWNDLLPLLEYIHTKVTLDDIWGYKNKSPISEMLSWVLSSIIETDQNYIELKNKFIQLFGNETSEVRTKLDLISDKVEVYLKKQFPSEASVRFNVDIPEFTDLLKKFSTEVNDWVPTLVEEKGDWMQRAVMLSIIQAYADFRRENSVAKKFIFLIDEAELHLHPSAQRELKKALHDISANWDQVFVNTHSSVLIVDNSPNQEIYKVEKQDKVTEILKINDLKRVDIIFDLLWGSPSDLLLPRNFLIVEWRSEFAFLSKIIERFYSSTLKWIKILYSWWDIEMQEPTLLWVHRLYSPLAWNDNPIYKDRAIVLLDKPNTRQENQYQNFKRGYKYLFDNHQVFELDTNSLEEYYPEPHKVAGLPNWEKVKYAESVAGSISQEDFEEKMPIIFNALKESNSKGFNPL